MGFALKSYLNAELKPGIDIVISFTGLEASIRAADLVITGEGRIDSQTSKGKVISGITRIAKKFGKKVIAFCGSVSDDANVPGLDKIIPVTPEGMPLQEAMKPDVAADNLELAAETIGEIL
jgi:glycerate kinase